MTPQCSLDPLRISQRLIATLCVIVFIVQSGCVTVPPLPKTQYQASLGKVVVVASSQIPEFKFEGFARGKGAGAVTGAGKTFASCLGGMGGGSCGGDFCGAMIILWVGICGVAGTVGGIAGAANAPNAEEISASEASLTNVLDVRAVQESLRESVAETALTKGQNIVAVHPSDAYEAVNKHDYRSLAAYGADTVLEVAISKVMTEGSGLNDPLLLVMQAHVRLVHTSDNTEILSADYDHLGERLTLSEWSANDAKRLLNGIQSGYKALGTHIYENVFLLYPFPDRGAHTNDWFSASFGLAPIAPLTRGQLTENSLMGDSFEWNTASGLRPTLRWEEFPRSTDIAIAPEDMGRVRKVRYDLVISRERNLVPGEIVYRQEGLSEPSHTVQTVLWPRARYFWTVRAHFEFDGRERVTEWGSTHYMAREKYTAPSPWSYRFRVP